MNSKGIYIGGHRWQEKKKEVMKIPIPCFFENAVYILSDAQKENDCIKNLTEIIQLLGARITFLNPYIHDKVVAMLATFHSFYL